MTNVLLVTTWDKACGIAEHSAMLVDAVTHADARVQIAPCRELDPGMLMRPTFADHQVLHLNYHAALHSRWTPDWIRQFQQLGKKVLVTGHDSGIPNSAQLTAVIEAADAAIVHETFDDLPEAKTHYWRMGVPGWQPPWHFRHEHDERPMLGTIGFPYAWKNYDLLCEITARAGWALLLIAPGATLEQVEGWSRRQPHLVIRTEFTPRDEAVSLLTGCDATAFTYTCAFAGQSGALLMGIAARKPVIALSNCRQFRALYEDPLGSGAIHWCQTFEQVEKALHWVPIARVDPGIVALAEQESWSRLGQRYAGLYRELAS